MEHCGRKKFYVSVGVSPGIYKSWETCAPNVVGFNGSVYKSYRSKADAVHAYNLYQCSLNETVEEEPSGRNIVGDSSSIGQTHHDPLPRYAGADVKFPTLWESVMGFHRICCAVVVGFVIGVVVMFVI